MKMVFEITGKVALVTGGANGIGLCHVKELLRQGVKGVTIADVNESEGKKVIDEIGNEFGRSKAVFVKADVCNKEDFEMIRTYLGNINIHCFITSQIMVFEIAGKVALVTGGASGIGLCHVKELLRQGVKGVTIVDLNETAGENALDEIEKEFGKGKVIFVKTDITNKDEFENAFKKTVERFGNIDILVSNAGITNDSIWEKEIAINVNGSVIGIILALENYLKNHKQGDEAVIVNTCSIDALYGIPLWPIYCGTKYAVAGLTAAWGVPFHYDRTKVRVVAVCPSATRTGILQGAPAKSVFLPEYAKWVPCPIEFIADYGQRPEHVAKELVRIIKFAQNGTMWAVEDSQPTYEFKLPERESLKGNLLKEN